MIHIKEFHHPHLIIPDWRILSGEAWCIIGRNGSGKKIIDQLLMGELSDTPVEMIERTVSLDAIRLISFEQQQLIYERELKLAANDMLEESDTATLAKDFIPPQHLENPLIDELGLRQRLTARYTELSTGESRKLLVLQALFKGAQCLIVDNPFDSLDPHSCRLLNRTLQAVNSRGVTVLFLLSNRQDIPSWCDHIGVVDGERLDIMNTSDPEALAQRIHQALQLSSAQPDWPESAIGLDEYSHDALVTLNDCTVSFADTTVLDGVSLSVVPLQHTLITGENGSGKSTLLGLITGDCPQCFSNDVTVLGYRRGRGESVWDIKRDMGIVSNDLHRRYRVHCNVETVVCSGFFDSIGVYDPIGDQQRVIASQWLEAAGLKGRGPAPFQSLSYGEQRLALIARALVKSPLLLILDEPTQGLDELNRGRLLALLEILHQREHSTLLFVSHREDEHLPIFAQRYHLQRLST